MSMDFEVGDMITDPLWEELGRTLWLGEVVACGKETTVMWLESHTRELEIFDTYYYPLLRLYCRKL